MAVRARGTRERDPLEMAETAFARVEADAAGAERLAAEALQLARTRRSPDAEAAALHALAFARYELGDPRSLRSARAAVRVAERHGLTRRAAHARRRLAFDLSDARPALGRRAGARPRLCGLRCARARALAGVPDRDPDPLRPSAPTPCGTPTARSQTLQARGRPDLGGAAAAQPRPAVRRSRADPRGGARPDSAPASCTHRSGPTKPRPAPRSSSPASRSPGETCRTASPGSTGSSRPRSPRRSAPTSRCCARGRSPPRISPARHWRRCRRRRRSGTAGGSTEPEGRLEAVRLTLLAGDAAGRATPRARRVGVVRRARQPDLSGRGPTACGSPPAIAAGAAAPRPRSRPRRRAAATLAEAGWREEAQRIRVAVARARVRARPAGGRAAGAGGLRGAAPPRTGRGPDRGLARRGAAAPRCRRSDRRRASGPRGPGSARSPPRGARRLGPARERLGDRSLTRPARPADCARGRAAWAAARVVGAHAGQRAQARPGRPAGRCRAARAPARAARGLQASCGRASAERPRRPIAGRSSGSARDSDPPARPPPERRGPRADARFPAAGADHAALRERGLLELIELDGRLSALTLAGGRLTRHALGPSDR